MKFVIVSLVLCSLGVMGQLKDPKDLPTAEPKSKPEPAKGNKDKGDKNGGNNDGGDDNGDDNTNTNTPTSNPTSGPTAPFDFCGYHSYTSGQKCGNYGYDEKSTCHPDVDGTPVCVQHVGNLCSLNLCYFAFDCGTGFACVAGECGRRCMPLCGHPGHYGGDDGHYGVFDDFYYNDDDLNPRCYGIDLNPGLAEADSLPLATSFIASHLSSLVFGSLVVVVVLGTFLVVRSSQLSSTSSPSTSQDKFQELSTMESSVDRLIIRKNDIEMEPVTRSSSAKAKSQTLL